MLHFLPNRECSQLEEQSALFQAVQLREKEQNAHKGIKSQLHFLLISNRAVENHR